MSGWVSATVQGMRWTAEGPVVVSVREGEAEGDWLLELVPREPRVWREEVDDDDSGTVGELAFSEVGEEGLRCLLVGFGECALSLSDIGGLGVLFLLL